MVRNSPWAMLMTPIWPKMMASPSAISSSTQNELSPLNPCMTAIENRSDIDSMVASEEMDGVGPGGLAPGRAGAHW